MVFNLDMTDAIADKNGEFKVPHALIDLGHGATKYTFVKQGQKPIGPANFVSVLRNISVPRYEISDNQSILIEIIKSTNPAIKGRKLVGKDAKGSPQSMSAGKQNKYSAAIAPWLLFAAIGLGIPKKMGIKKFVFSSAFSRLLVLLPNPQLEENSAEFKEAIVGEHSIRITRQGDFLGTVEVLEGEIGITSNGVGLFPEGSMAFSYCEAEGLIQKLPENSRVLTLCCGHNTAIFSQLSSNGKLQKRQIYPHAGCLELIDAICNAPEMESLVKDTVNPELVTEGIINRSDERQTAFYGQPLRGLNFYEIYDAALEQWQQQINMRFWNFLDPGIAATVECVVAIGKPVELFKPEYRIKDFRFLEFPEGCDPRYVDLIGMYHKMANATNSKGEPANLFA